MAPCPTASPEQLREAVRDLLGIVRAYYLAEHDKPHNRRVIAEAGQLLAAVLTAEDGSPEFATALEAADRAVNAVLNQMHFVAPLAPVMGHAAGRAFPSRRG